MKKTQVNFYIPEEIFQNLSKMKREKIWNSSITVNFIFKSYLENPDNFDFYRRKWTDDKIKTKNKKLISIHLENEIYKDLRNISNGKEYMWSEFLRVILDIYFLDHPEYCPAEEKPLF